MTPSMQPRSDASQSASNVGVRRVVSALALMVPLWIALSLPFGCVWVYLFGTMLAQWVENRLRGAVNLTWVWWLGACVGASVALARRTDAIVTGVLMAGACLVALALVGRAWEKIARLVSAHDDPGPTLTRIEGSERPRGRLPGDAAPVTPEGGRLRIVGCHEPRNSAPLQYDYLFPDGSVVFGAGTPTAYSPDGRYFVSPMPTTGAWGLLIYDRDAQRVYRCNKVETFVDLHRVTQTHVEGWGSRIEKDGCMLSAAIEDLLAHSVSEPMVDIADLRIPESHADHARRRREVELPPAPAGAPALTLVAYLPSSLMALDDPLEPLFSPWSELIVDDQPSGLLICGRNPRLLWSDDGRSLTCVAKPKGRDAPPGQWRWSTQQGWHAVDESGGQP